MAFYYFHINEIEDRTGSDLPSFAAAREEALDVVSNLLPSSDTEAFWRGASWRLSVTKEGGAEVLSINVTARSP